MHCFWKTHIRCVTAAFFLSLAFTGTALADDSLFVAGTMVNGLGIGGLSAEAAHERLSQFYAQQYQLTIKEKGGKQETINGTDIGYSVSIPEGYLEELLASQAGMDRSAGPESGTRLHVDVISSYSEELLDAKIQALKCLTSSTPTQDARITEYRPGKPFEIIKEVYGTNVYPEKVAAAVKTAVAAGDAELDLQTADCYYQVNITSTNPELNDLLGSMNRCRTMSVTYTIGDAKETLDSSTICSWMQGTTSDGQLQVNRAMVSAWLTDLAARYDTSGKERSFHTADGRDITVSGGFFGWKINRSAETDALIEIIRSGHSQEREPIYAQTALTRAENEPEWGHTYAEVDLTNQHVYMIQEGNIVWDSPCVTGNVKKGNGTPAGLYSLTYKEPNRILRGQKRADGSYEYETPVSYWMPFNGGIGFHDANWRSSFGGTIYQSNGSHGCINLPPAKAAALYDLVYKGMPVICYN